MLLSKNACISVIFLCQEKQAAKDSEGVPDEEGWITVTRNKGSANTETNDHRLKKKLKKRIQEKVSNDVQCCFLLSLDWFNISL